MKQTICSAAVLLSALAASSAMAQSNVQIYGIVDSGVVYTDNAPGGGSAVKVPGLTSSFPSRIGFRGTEDLGNGLQAFFNLENGLSLDTGTVGQGNRLFGRAANVGVKGSFGTVTLGRQVNMTFLSTLKSDVLGPHLFALGTMDGYLPNARSDNAIGYLGTFNGFTVGATYSLGRDAVASPPANASPAASNCGGELGNDSKACRQYTALLGYDTGRWGVTTSYDRLYGGPANANGNVGGGLISSDHKDTRITLNGFAMIGATKIGGGAIQRDQDSGAANLDSTMYYLGATQPLGGPLTLDVQVIHRDEKDRVDADVTMAVARLTYALSKRTFLHASYGRVDNDTNASQSVDAGGAVAQGKNQNGVLLGLRHHF
jgi:predicted porin